MGKVSEQIQALRIDYIHGTLETASVAAEPIAQFERWMNEALEAEVPEANAIALATVSAEGQPSVRIVLLRGVDAEGFVWYTNYQSRKGRDLADCPKAAFSLFWPELERQIRVEGTVEQVPAEMSDAYFAQRPRKSQIGACASPQSSVIADRGELEAAVEARTAEFESGEVARP
ncbi:MAG: pyridoxamine 5'-phosphate oxidase, partial [Bacteroidota bacterium]